MKFSKRIVVGIVLIQIVSSAVHSYLHHYQYSEVLDVTIQKKGCDTNHIIENIFNELKEEYSAYAKELLLNQNITEAFASKNREQLYKLSGPVYEGLKKNNKYFNIMNFYTADTHSFLRLNKPEQFGEDLQEFRKMVLQVNETKEARYGIESGKYGIYYRVIFPVFKEGTHIGAFEFGVDIKYLISKLSLLNLKTPMLLVTNKTAEPIYKYDEDAADYLEKFAGDYSFVKCDAADEESVSILDVTDSRIIEENEYLVVQDDVEYLLFRGYDLHDYKNAPIGYFVFMDKMNYYMDTIVFVRWVSIITTISLMIIIILLIYKLIADYAAEIRKQKSISEYHTYYDVLTELPNRVLFNDRLQLTINEAKREKSLFAVLLIGLDRFKQINDSLGHVIGDEVLRIISKRLERVVRSEDTVSRLGGDEFAIIAKNLQKAEDASFLAKKIIASFSGSIHVQEQTLYVTGSIGISLFPEDGAEAGVLVKNADAAMFRAKDEGRNNFQYYSLDMTERALERVVMEANLRKALKNDEFIVYYQPQVESKTGKMVGMEALVRWRHPSEGLIYPNSFIQLAQDTGLIVAIDRLVMRMAMKQVSRWYAKGLNPGVLALNLAMKQLAKEDFIDTLNAMFEECRFQPEWLELEVTEGEIMKNPQNAIEVLRKISDMGIELAVDDFGTGYSSLSYLKRLPIDKLKIDKSFVDGLPENEEDISIARAIVALAHSLKLSVIAEGVENVEQKEFFAQNGCDFIQGYYYSKPIQSEEMEEMLKKGKSLDFFSIT